MFVALRPFLFGDGCRACKSVGFTHETEHTDNLISLAKLSCNMSLYVVQDNILQSFTRHFGISVPTYNYIVRHTYILHQHLSAYCWTGELFQKMFTASAKLKSDSLLASIKNSTPSEPPSNVFLAAFCKTNMRCGYSLPGVANVAVRELQKHISIHMIHFKLILHFSTVNFQGGP